MAKTRTGLGRAASYRLEAELARGRAVAVTDVEARNTMLEVAKMLDELADIEEGRTSPSADEKTP